MTKLKDSCVSSVCLFSYFVDTIANKINNGNNEECMQDMEQL